MRKTRILQRRRCAGHRARTLVRTWSALSYHALSYCTAQGLWYARGRPVVTTPAVTVQRKGFGTHGVGP